MLNLIFDTEISHWSQKHRQTGVSTGSQASFNKMILPRGKLHLTRKSEDLLQWESIFWKLAWEPIATPVWRSNRGQCEISISKIGFTIQIYWNNHRNIKKAEKTLKIRVFKKWTFFGRKKSRFFLFPWVRTASPGFQKSILRKKYRCLRKKKEIQKS